MSKRKSVEQYLDAVSYDYASQYLPSKFSLMFVNFIKLVNADKGGEEHKTPVMHYKMLDTIDRNVKSSKSIIRIANMCARGTAKTTLMGEYFILFTAVYGKLDGFGSIKLGMYVSDSIENGVKNMRKNLEYRWQNSDFLQVYLPNVRFTDVRWEFTNASRHTTVWKGYGAQSLSLSTKLHTLKGFVTIGECKVGDNIYGADGELTTITAKSVVFNKPMYVLELVDGRAIEISEDHLNSVIINTNPNNLVRYESRTLTTLELLKQPLIHTKKGNVKHKGISSKVIAFVRNCKPIQKPVIDLPIDPYTYGLLLGDGTMQLKNNCCTVVLIAHKDDWVEYVKTIPYSLGAIQMDKRNGNVISRTIRGLTKIVRERGYVQHGDYKTIDPIYFNGSEQQRLELLRGLIDSDGSITKSGRITYTSNSLDLVEGVKALVRSLGGKANSKIVRTLNDKHHYKTELWINKVPCKLTRKKVRFKLDRFNWDLVAIKSLTRIKDLQSQCIAVDNEERQFIVEDYFRTHNTGIRGVKEMGVRPNIAIGDDLISDTDARSPTVIASVEDTIYKAITYALHPSKNMIIWSGTPFNARDPLYKAVTSGAWDSNVFPICERFPCKWSEFRGAWEDRFGYEYVKSQFDTAKALGKQDTFDQELMLRIMSDEDRLVPDEFINWFSLKLLLKNLSMFDIYITTDFATSAKDSADFSVISVWAHNYNRDWFYIDGVTAKQDMGDNIDDLFRLCTKYRPLKVGIEISGQQGGFIPWIKQQQMERNCFFSIGKDKVDGKAEEGYRPTTNKLERFKTILPWIKQGHLYLPEELKDDTRIEEAMDELSLASPNGFRSLHDDWLDTVSMLSRLQAYRPSQRVLLDKNQTANELNDKYQGVSLWELEKEEDKVEVGFSSYMV